MGRKSRSRKKHHKPTPPPAAGLPCPPAPVETAPDPAPPPAIAEPAPAPPVPAAPPTEPIRSLRPGELIAQRYRLLRIVGRGAMGITWAARDESTGTEFALKFLVAGFVHDADRLSALRESVARSAALDHPHILRTFDLVEDPERQLLAVRQELAADSLYLRQAGLPGRRFEPEAIAAWIPQLCAALLHAHEAHQCIHRDLKPTNLLISAEGALKLADFGIPQIPELRMLHLGSSPSSGLPTYHSPEQLRGEPPAVADDLYALGVTLYELLTGAPPFRATSVSYQLFQIEQNLPALSGSIGPDAVLPEAWERCILSLLSRTASERPGLGACTEALVLSGSEPVITPSAAATEATSAPSVTASSTTPAAASTAGPVPHPAEEGEDTTSWKSVALIMGVVGIAVGSALWFSGSDSGKSIPTSPIPATPLAVAPPPTRPAPCPTQPAAGIFINTLGMRFTPVPGLGIRFCVWPTRVRDFATFAARTGLQNTRWQDPGYKQTADDPVANVTWQEAVAFCEWLTRIEREQGKIAPHQLYRLPTDTEWSGAVGLPTEPGATPAERDLSIQNRYPWGTAWPPPPGAGNYAGKEIHDETAITDYEDDFEWTSPVGSFPANQFGLYDMGGNVWQWVEDFWSPGSEEKVARGASFSNGSIRLSLLSSARVHTRPDAGHDNFGFRVVLAETER